MPTGTVTVTQGGSIASGMRALLKVITGQAVSPIGQSNSATSITPSLALAGTTAGSLVYGSNLGLAGTYTPNGATVYQADNIVGATGLEYISLRSLSTVAGGTVTLGGSTTTSSISIALLEILKGAGALAEDASGPAAFGGTGTTITSASFGPPGSSLLVLSIQSNGAAGIDTMAVTDTLGGLAWAEQVKVNTAGSGYSGLWTAPVPASVASTGFLLGMEG
jgi:hypothetical protein